MWPWLCAPFVDHLHLAAPPQIIEAFLAAVGSPGRAEALAVECCRHHLLPRSPNLSRQQPFAEEPVVTGLDLAHQDAQLVPLEELLPERGPSSGTPEAHWDG